MSEIARLLDAGGLVAASLPAPEGMRVDTVDARVYGHPGMPDRAVVRLVPDAIADGVDSEMNLLGFGLSGHHDDIALQRHRSLGFPGWVLVNDPKRARVALEVMKPFRVEAKRALSKPGHARDGFAEIAGKLARSVPHFLPTFWEEAGRAFVEAGNPKMAATAFERARQAEREFGLAIDEERRTEVFLEFALAGALTVKSLQGWARELAAAEGPEVAYERFYALAVRRTLGGLAPWAGIAKDLRGLAKAARRDPAAEDERFLTDVLPASIERAPASFWDDYRKVLIRLGQRDPEVRQRLLEILPNAGQESWRGVDDELALSWLDLLHETGALSLLLAGGGLSSGTRARWLGRAADWASRGFGPLLPIARAMAPRLREESLPVPLTDEDGWGWVDVDLADLLLELGVPVRFGSPRFSLDQWGQSEPVDERWGLPGEARPRDPVHLAGHAELARRLADAVGESMGDEGFERSSQTSVAFAQARRTWLAEAVEQVAVGGVPAVQAAIGVLAEKTQASTWIPVPDLLERLRAVDLSRGLAASLRVGLAEELGWPAFEQALADTGTEDLTIAGPYPYTVVGSARKIVVLGPDGQRLTTIDPRIPKGGEFQRALWMGSQLLVAVTDGDYAEKGYWSGQPKELFDVDIPYGDDDPVGIPAPGGVSLGFAAVRPGDQGWPAWRQVFSDGAQAWVLGQRTEGRLPVHRFDPDTGALGVEERPAFLADVEALWVDDCTLVPAPSDSPLGVRDGVYGLRILGNDDGVEGIDGRKLVGKLAGDERPEALVTFPGHPAPRPVRYERWSSEEGVEIWSPDGAWMASSGWPGGHLPLSRWHWLQPRDPAGSAALRAIDDARAAALLASPEEVARVLPEVTDPLLAGAITRIAARAALAAKALGDLLEGRAGGETSADGIDEGQARESLGVFAERGWSDEPLEAAIRWSGGFLRGAAEGEVRSVELDWPSWFGRIRAFGWAIARADASDEARETLLSLLEAWVDAGLCELAPVRRATWIFDNQDSPFLATKRDDDGDTVLEERWTRVDGGWRAIATTDDTWSDTGPYTVQTLETSAGGVFPTPFGGRLESETIHAVPGESAERIRALIAVARGRGARAVRPEEVELVAARTGLGRGAATLLLAGAPGFSQWTRDFLGKELREALGLKVADAAAGKDALSLGTAAWLALYGAAMPDDPAKLWDAAPDDPDGPAVRLAEAWVAQLGVRTPIPDDIQILARKEIPHGADALAVLAAPDGDPRLKTDGRYVLGDTGDVEVEGEATAAFDGELGQQLAALLPWAFSALPVGDPLRANLPKVVDAVRERLRNPQLLVSAGGWWVEAEKKAKLLFDSLGGTVEQTQGDDIVWRRDTGGLCAVRSEGLLGAAVRPARIDGETWELVDRLSNGLGDPESSDDQTGGVRVLMGPGLAAMAARVRSTPVPEGGWEQDPAASMPKLVAEVAKTCKVSNEAARLYLQTLALPAPTKKAVTGWNGWSTKVYAAAAEELVGARRLLVAKRARAGRDHFLPGAWLDRSAPDLPLERWKAPLYGGVEVKSAVRFPMGSVVVLEPFHDLFARAWARVVAGDGPGFE